LWIGIELVGDEFGLVHDSVGVGTVTISEQIISLVVENIPFLGGRVLHDIPLLSEAFTDICVDRLEPFLQLGIFLGITVDGVDGVE
jgi:hypothetical protein